MSHWRIRDLKIYSSANNGVISYYHDRYALIEFKLGQSEVDEGAYHLCEIEKLIKEHNKNEKQCPLRLQDLKIVITGTQYGYKRDD